MVVAQFFRHPAHPCLRDLRDLARPPIFKVAHHRFTHFPTTTNLTAWRRESSTSTTSRAPSWIHVLSKVWMRLRACFSSILSSNADQSLTSKPVAQGHAVAIARSAIIWRWESIWVFRTAHATALPIFAAIRLASISASSI